MKKLFNKIGIRLLFLLFGLLILTFANSCEKSKNEKELTNSNGDLKEFEIENNLINQLNSYYFAYTNSNTDSVIFYIMPDVFIWLQKQSPEYSENEIIEMTKKFIIDLKNNLKKKKMSTRYLIDTINNKVFYKNVRIYNVLTTITFIDDKNTEIVEKGEVIALSKDNGINWKFSEKDYEVSSDVLKLSLPDSIVDQVMNTNK